MPGGDEAAAPAGAMRRPGSLSLRPQAQQRAGDGWTPCDDDEGGDAADFGRRLSPLPRDGNASPLMARSPSSRSLLRHGGAAKPSDAQQFWPGRDRRRSVADAAEAGEREMATHSARHLSTHLLLLAVVLCGFLVLHARSLKTCSQAVAALVLVLSAMTRLRRGRNAVLGSLRALGALLWTAVALQCAVSAAGVQQMVMSPECVAASVLRCVRADFWRVHFPLSIAGWLMAGMPPRLMWFPELMNAASLSAAGLRAAYIAGELHTLAAATLLAELALRCVVTPLAFAVLFSPQPSVEALLAEVETTPRPLRPLRDTTLLAGAALRQRLLGGVQLLDARACMVITCTALWWWHRWRGTASRAPPS